MSWIATVPLVLMDAWHRPQTDGIIDGLEPFGVRLVSASPAPHKAGQGEAA